VKEKINGRTFRQGMAPVFRLLNRTINTTATLKQKKTKPKNTLLEQRSILV
jgi:hypothetical protein